MTVRRHLLAALVLCACSSPGLAQLSPKPELGLWETRSKTTVNGRDMVADMRASQEAMMKSLPPAERAQMAEAMKEQGGPAGETDQECLDAKSLTDWSDPKARLREMEQNMRGCKLEPMATSGSTFQFKGRCADPQGFTGDIAGTMTMKSSRAWTFLYTGNGKAQGQPMAMRVEANGRWLSASCGAVKPDR